MAQWKVRCQRCGPRQMRQACLLLKVHHWVGCCFSVPCLWAAFEGVRSGFEFFVHGHIAVFVERPRRVFAILVPRSFVVQEACSGDQFVEGDVA